MPASITTLMTVFLALLQVGEPEGYDKDIILIFVLSAYTVILPLVFGGIGYKKLDTGLRLFFILLCAVLVSETIAYYLSKGPTNLIVYDVFTAVEYTLLMMMFSRWYKAKAVRNAMLASIPVFLLVWTVAKFVLDDYTQFDSIFLSIESVVFVFISVVTLGKEMRDGTVLLVDNPRFWISSGILVYFAGNLFVFALIEQLLQPSVPRYHTAWMIHTGLNITKNILFTIGFLSTGGPAAVARGVLSPIRRKKN